MRHILSICCLVLFFKTTFSQWNPNTFENLAVSSKNCSDLQTAATSDGKTWVAFYSQNAATGNYDMRVQLLDALGNKLMGPDGMVASALTSGSATFVFNVCVDAGNNLIIGYQYDAGGVFNVAVAKVTPAGALPWGTGVVLGQGLAPYPAVNKTNDIVVGWNNNSPSTVYVQKVSSGGSLMWANPVSITVGTSNTTRGQIVCHTNGDFTAVFQKKSFGISTTLYAQRYSNDGVALWTSPLQLCNETTSGARYYSVLADGNTAYCGYYSSVGFRFNSYLQKIPASGVLPWGINGAPFSTYNSDIDPSPQTTWIAKAAGSDHVWASSTYSNSSQTQYGVFVQKFDTATGNRLLDPLGKEVFPISSTLETQAGALSLFNDAPFFAVYDNNYKIYATRLNTDGNFVWPGNRIELSSTTSTLANPKGRFSFTPCINSQVVSVWAENRGTDDIAYAQAINAFGTLPVTLKDFYGTAGKGRSDLFWTTASEMNAFGFDVERSSNGNDFSAIGFVKTRAAGGTSQLTLDYSFTDNRPLPGINYYRLRQVDADGKFLYSKVIALKFEGEAGLQMGLPSPNPARHFTVVSIYARESAKGQLLLSNTEGKTIRRIPLSLTGGENNNIRISLDNLPAGTYFIRTISGIHASVPVSLVVE